MKKKQQLVLYSSLLSVAISMPAMAAKTVGENIEESKSITFDARDANVNLAVIELDAVRGAIHNYYLKNNAFPANLAVLSSGNFYSGNFKTPYGTITGNLTANGYNLSIPVPSGGSQKAIVKMIASRSGAKLASNEQSFTMAVDTPTSAAIVDSMLSRISDPSRPDNNKMMQNLNFNGFDAQGVNELTANIINVTTINIDDAMTLKNLTVTESTTLEGGVNVNSNTGTNNLVVSRSGDDVVQAINLGVSDRTADFTYIEDTNSEGHGDFGTINFKLGGNNGEAIVTPLAITKDGLVSLGHTVWTAGSDGKNSGLDADKLDNVSSENFGRRDEANTFAETNTFTKAIKAEGGLSVGGKTVISADGLTLYEGGKKLTELYLEVGETAVNANKLGDVEAVRFARRDERNTFSEVNTFSQSVYVNGKLHANDGIKVDGKHVVSSDGSTLFEDNIALRDRYLSIDGKASSSEDSDRLGEVEAKYYARRDVSNIFLAPNTFNSTVTVKGTLNADNGIKVDGKNVVSADGNTLYENNRAIRDIYVKQTPESISDVRSRIDSGFYESSSASTSTGFPTSGWTHLLASTHSNNANYYSMQFANSFYNQDLYFRSTQNDGNRAWNEIWHSGSDGKDSGLDADKIHGVSGSRLAVKDLDNTFIKNNTFNGVLTANGQVRANAGLSQDGHVVLNGSDTWLRTKDSTGWYNATYGGGLYMRDSTWVRTYNGKKFLVDNTASDAIYTYGGLKANGVITVGQGINSSGDIKIAKNNAWLTLDSPGTGANGVEQAAGISIGESGKKGSAALHMTYTGDGYAHIGMGSVSSSTSIPAYEAMRLHYQSRNVSFLGDINSSGNVNISGTKALKFSTYGGGLYMQDTTWLRTVGGKKFYVSSTSSDAIYTAGGVKANGLIRADGGFQVDGKWVVSSTGNTLYENGTALSNKYLGKTAKAADADKLDNINSSQFARRDVANTFTQANTFNSTLHVKGTSTFDSAVTVSNVKLKTAIAGRSSLQDALNWIKDCELGEGACNDDDDKAAIITNSRGSYRINADGTVEMWGSTTSTKDARQTIYLPYTLTHNDYNLTLGVGAYTHNTIDKYVHSFSYDRDNEVGGTTNTFDFRVWAHKK